MRTQLITWGIILGVFLGIVSQVKALTLDGQLSFVTVDGGTVDWSTEQNYLGQNSVKFWWPAEYIDEETELRVVPQSSISVEYLEKPLLSTFASWSYWIYSPASYTPSLTFFLDTNQDAVADLTVQAYVYDAESYVWKEITHQTIQNWMGVYYIQQTASEEVIEMLMDWDTVLTNYGHYPVTMVTIGKPRTSISNPELGGITAYIDGLSINGEYSEFEPVIKTVRQTLLFKGVPGNGIDTAPGLRKPFNPKSHAPEAILKK